MSFLAGSTATLVEAVFGPPPAIAAEVDTTGLDGYKELLQKIKVHSLALYDILFCEFWS